MYGQSRTFNRGNEDASSSQDNESYWSDQKVLEDRASLDVSSDPARLTLRDLKEKDAGLYHCRVDFLAQPTKTTRVTLIVVG